MHVIITQCTVYVYIVVDGRIVCICTCDRLYMYLTNQMLTLRDFLVYVLFVRYGGKRSFTHGTWFRGDVTSGLRGREGGEG